MPHNFNTILTSYGFITSTYDFDSTTLGWLHDLHNALLDSETIFDIDQCQIIQNLDNPNAFIRCELVTINNDIDAGIEFFHQRWRSELQYQNPVREIIDVQQRNDTATIQVLTISKDNAMTIRLNIK